MTFSTVNQLVGNIKHKIGDVEAILNVLLSEYRFASEIIDSSTDPRDIYLQQLKDLNKSLTDIVDGHPALVASNPVPELLKIAESKKDSAQI